MKILNSWLNLSLNLNETNLTKGNTRQHRVLTLITLEGFCRSRSVFDFSLFRSALAKDSTNGDGGGSNDVTDGTRNCMDDEGRESFSFSFEESEELDDVDRADLEEVMLVKIDDIGSMGGLPPDEQPEDDPKPDDPDDVEIRLERIGIAGEEQPLLQGTEFGDGGLLVLDGERLVRDEALDEDFLLEMDDIRLARRGGRGELLGVVQADENMDRLQSMAL